jgi:hypothetical protein
VTPIDKSLGDLPLVIEIFVSFHSFRCTPLAKRHKISITRGRSPGLSQEHMQEPIILKILVNKNEIENPNLTGCLFLTQNIPKILKF